MSKVLLITNEITKRSGYGRVSLGLSNSLKKKGHEVVIVSRPSLPAPLSLKKNFLFFWVYILKLFKRKKELKSCDAILCIVESYALFTCFLSWLLGKKFFVVVHGTYGVLFFRYKIYGFLQKLSYKYAEKIICVSNYTKEQILKYGDFKNLTVINNGVNLEEFASDKDSKKEQVLMSLGAFKERKGFKWLIKALPEVIKEIPDLKCFIGGGKGVNKDYYDKVVKLAEDLGVSKNIEFFYNVSDEYIGDLYKKSKVFALTPISRKYNFEGFGLIYLEANAHGLPVVGMAGSGVEDAINDGYSGFLAKEKDVKDIANKIIKLFKDENLYQQISQNATAWAKEHSWDVVVQDYEKVLFTNID